MMRPLSFSALLCLAICAPWTGASFAADTTFPVTIVTLGDSLITGHGLPTVSRFASVLEQRLKDAGYDAIVIDPGFRYTSQSGVEWLDHPSTMEGLFDLSTPKTGAIVEIGSNDCPAGLALDETRANLDQILSRFSALKIPVLLVGSTSFESCGADYAVAFERIFSDLANSHEKLLYPDFTTGVYGHSDLLQSDLNHPNVAGESIIVDNMLPMVEQLIARIEAQ